MQVTCHCQDNKSKIETDSPVSRGDWKRNVPRQQSLRLEAVRVFPFLFIHLCLLLSTFIHLQINYVELIYQGLPGNFRKGNKWPTKTMNQ